MDIATIVGFVLGAGCIVFGIITSGTPFMTFVDVPSILIVVGGTFGGLLISNSLQSFLGGLKTAKHTFSNKASDPVGVIKQINDLAFAARKEGLLALEEIGQNMDDLFLQKGIMLIVDGTDAELLRSILETELAFIEARHKDNQKFWEGMAEAGPAWGMIGTLVGLIGMLGALDDPTTIGPKMAVALITTLYGSMIANYIAGPIAGKLKAKSADEILHKQVMIEGLLSIQAGENPRVIEEKLKAFLSPASRGTIGEAAGKDE